MADVCINILTDSDLNRLADATLTVLERTGVMYQSSVILDALEAAGAIVDRDTHRARLPRCLVETVIEHQRRRAPAEGPPAARREPAPPDAHLPGIQNQVAQFYYDHDLGVVLYQLSSHLPIPASSSSVHG